MRRPDTDAQFRETPFTFRVLDSPVVNAFALPGGYIYVTRGLLSHLDNEAQLAVVLGHEIVHVAARHASRRAFEQQLGQVGLLGGAILGGQVFGGQAAQAILDLGGTAAQLLFLRYGRDDEREADELGVEYAALVGYQTEEAAEFFRSLRRIGEEQQQGLPTWMSTHPDPGEREQSMHRLRTANGVSRPR
jgi:predicted Zn-dependent protease